MPDGRVESRAPKIERQPEAAGDTESRLATPSSRITSQGFYPPSDPAVLRRSMILSGVASALGAVFFTVIQGTVFNFFLEDLSLRARLPYFMGLWCIGGLGSMVGSWLQGAYGCRKLLFMVGIGGSRIVWLAIGLIPWLRPEWASGGAAFTWLTVLTLIFYFVHSLGAPAWFSWMADLVPARLQSRYWSLRQVGASGCGILARIVFGFFLDAHRQEGYGAYAVIFCAATVFGLLDAILYFWVEHRRPKLRVREGSIFGEFTHRLREKPFRRLCGVYLLWSVSNCIMGPTCYYFMRDQVAMGVTSISVVDAIGLCCFTIFSVLWGKFSDYHGHRGPLVICILLMAVCPIFYFFAHAHDIALVTISMALANIGFCGIQLFMWPLLINTQKGKGGRETGMAAFTVLTGAANFAMFTSMDRVLYPAVAYVVDAPTQSTRVYLSVIAIAMLVRLASAAIAWTLPETSAAESTPRLVLSQVVSTNPLRAAVGFVKYMTGQEEWQELEAAEQVTSEKAEEPVEEN